MDSGWPLDMDFGVLFTEKYFIEAEAVLNFFLFVSGHIVLKKIATHGREEIFRRFFFLFAKSKEAVNGLSEEAVILCR